VLSGARASQAVASEIDPVPFVGSDWLLMILDRRPLRSSRILKDAVTSGDPQNSSIAAIAARMQGCMLGTPLSLLNSA
jgi:hypothetical protein